MIWRRYTLTQTPDTSTSLHYSVTPSKVIANIWGFLDGQVDCGQVPFRPREYVCLGIVMTDQGLMSDHSSTTWDYWATLNYENESMIVNYYDVIRWMVSTCAASSSNTHDVFMGHHDETNELIQLRIRYYAHTTHSIHDDNTHKVTNELVIIKHNDRIFPNERSLFANPLTTELESHSEHLWERFNSPVSDIPNIPDQNKYMNVSYMMPYEEE